MRPGWSPVRRNRNIGTARQGHGADNRMVIPESWHSDRRFWDCLTTCVTVQRTIGAKTQRFLVEPPQPGWFYPCSIDDMAELLAHCLPEDLHSFDFIVLRQPTRKQRLLAPVGGRAVFAVEIGSLRGSAVFIEAQTLDGRVWSESRSLSPEQSLELQRLRQDGHRIIGGRRNIIIASGVDALRNTVLYRTLLHEIGHHVDKHRVDWATWQRKPSAEKEAFAHRYADKIRASLAAQGIVPFSPRLEEASLSGDGLRRE